MKTVHKGIKTIIRRPRANFSIFQNNPEINKLLFDNKFLDKESFTQLLSKQGPTPPVNRLHIFKIHGLTNALFFCSRYQILGYCVGSGIYTLFTISQKLKELEADTKEKKKKIQRKKTKLWRLAGLLVVSSTLGCLLTWLMGKRIVKSIYFLPQSREVEINFFSLFCFNRKMLLPLSDVRKIQKKPRFDSTIEYEYKKIGGDKYQHFSTRGTGVWVNRNIPGIIFSS